MTSETKRHIRRLLWRWGKTTVTCARLQKQRHDYLALIESATDVHGSPLTGMPGSGKVGDPTARAAERLAYLREKYEGMADLIEQEIISEIEFAKSIEIAMQNLDVQQRRIIDMHYRMGMSYVRIGEETYYSERQVKRYEAKAVVDLGEYILTK